MTPLVRHLCLFFFTIVLVVLYEYGRRLLGRRHVLRTHVLCLYLLFLFSEFYIPCLKTLYALATDIALDLFFLRVMNDCGYKNTDITKSLRLRVFSLFLDGWDGGGVLVTLMPCWLRTV